VSKGVFRQTRIQSQNVQNNRRTMGNSLGAWGSKRPAASGKTGEAQDKQRRPR